MDVWLNYAECNTFAQVCLEYLSISLSITLDDLAGILTKESISNTPHNRDIHVLNICIEISCLAFTPL